MTSAASTPKGERRRAALVAAAAELLAEGGFDAVRHRAVAERAGLPLASTTYYFDSLDELLCAAMEHRGRVELAAGRAGLDELTTEDRNVDAVVELVVDMVLGPDPRLEAAVLRYEAIVGTARRSW